MFKKHMLKTLSFAHLNAILPLLLLLLIGGCNTGGDGSSETTPEPTVDPAIATALDLASNFSGGNDDWEVFSTTFADDPTNTEMVLVPVGSFEMGSDFSNERPVHTQTIESPYWIDRYEVSNADYVIFLNEVGSSSEDGSYLPGGNNNNWRLDTRITSNDGTWLAVDAYADHPVSGLLWVAARDYCIWRGAHLPDEVEWEYAAAGPDDLMYPWGNEWDGLRVNHCDQDCADATGNPNVRATDVRDGFGLTAPVTAFAEGQSWVGAYQMAGNADEWLSSVNAEYPYTEANHADQDTIQGVDRIKRGGSWSNHDTNDLRASTRSGSTPWLSAIWTGFRCARDS